VVELCCKAYPGVIELSPLLVRCYCHLVMISNSSLSRQLLADMFMSGSINCPNRKVFSPCEFGKTDE
jgi:hypothetical protein